MTCIGIDQTWQLSTGLLQCQNDSVSNGSPAVEDGGMCSSWESGNGKLSTFRSWSRLSLCLNLVISECCKLWSRLSSNLPDVWCTEEDKSLCSLPRIRSEGLLPSVSWSLFKSRIWCRIKQVLLCSTFMRYMQDRRCQLRRHGADFNGYIYSSTRYSLMLKIIVNAPN